MRYCTSGALVYLNAGLTSGPFEGEEANSYRYAKPKYDFNAITHLTGRKVRF